MNIGLLGFGVVGGGVYEWCRGRSDLAVKRVLVRSEKPEISDISTRNIQDILDDSAIDTVVEAMGGLHPAYEYVRAALEAGKHVVTANKALIAACYADLTSLAAAKGVALRCTAAVGGGIPWLSNLERCARLDTLVQVGGIMNGTSNFILDAMHRAPADFDDVLRQAQALGYAEADPSADIDGDDVRRKLVISANIAFGAVLREEDIPLFGIRNVTAADIAAFRSHGFTCKLLADAQRTDAGVCAYIEPALVEDSALEAAVPANFNLITYTAESIGRHSFYGQGAGRLPTAANVMQDCLDIRAGQRAFYTASAVPMAVDGSTEAHPYYVRWSRQDDWLERISADRWGDAVVTGAVNTAEMLDWARRHEGCFIAGIR